MAETGPETLGTVQVGRATKISALQLRPSSERCPSLLLREDLKELPAAMVRVPREGFARCAAQAHYCCSVSWGRKKNLRVQEKIVKLSQKELFGGRKVVFFDNREIS